MAKRDREIILLLAISFILITILSCNNHGNDFSLTSSQNRNALRKKVVEKAYIKKEKYLDRFIEDKNLGGTKKPDCKTKVVTGWEVSYFTPMNGKYLGIWPEAHRFSSVARLKELREKWGFSYILINDISAAKEHFDMANIDAGFSKNEIALQIMPSDYSSKVNEFGNIYGYYIDEPYSRDYS